MDTWKKIANTKYMNKDNTVNFVGVAAYQQHVGKNKKYIDYEQDWVDKNLQPLIDFMGDDGVMECVFPSIEILNKRSDRTIKPSGKNQINFTGSHWTSRKSSDTKWFNPYDNL